MARLSFRVGIRLAWGSSEGRPSVRVRGRVHLKIDSAAVAAVMHACMVWVRVRVECEPMGGQGRS